jgi:hypothetical protein
VRGREREGEREREREREKEKEKEVKLSWNQGTTDVILNKCQTGRFA